MKGIVLLTTPRLTNLISAEGSVSVSFSRVTTKFFCATSWRMASSCCSSVPVPERRTCKAKWRVSTDTNENRRDTKAGTHNVEQVGCGVLLLAVVAEQLHHCPEKVLVVGLEEPRDDPRQDCVVP